MSPIGVLRACIAFLILVLLHFSVRPLLGWRAEIDFLLIAVLLAAVRVERLFSFFVGVRFSRIGHGSPSEMVVLR